MANYRMKYSIYDEGKGELIQGEISVKAGSLEKAIERVRHDKLKLFNVWVQAKV